MKENEKKNQISAPVIRIVVEGENQATTIMLNTILRLLTVLKNSCSDRQRENIWDMLEYQRSQVDVSKRVKITQPPVKKSLVSGNYYVYKEALDTISEVLEEIRRDDA
ncbi:MAG: hypothetical protein JXQ23_08900 [Clostridia bacterium]|nr:hypothetical protein [Clostridia bacterium]